MLYSLNMFCDRKAGIELIEMAVRNKETQRRIEMETQRRIETQRRFEMDHELCLVDRSNFTNVITVSTKYATSNLNLLHPYPLLLLLVLLEYWEL